MKKKPPEPRRSYLSLIAELKRQRTRLENAAAAGNKYAKLIMVGEGEEDDDAIYVPAPAFKSLGWRGTFDLALLVSFQINKRPRAEHESGGWFACSTKDLLDAYGKDVISPVRQSRILNKLEAEGFVKRMVKGSPPKRYIWIDFDKYVRIHLQNLAKLNDKTEEE